MPRLIYRAQNKSKDYLSLQKITKLKENKMKKIISLLLLSTMIAATVFAGGCGSTEKPVDTENNENIDNTEDENTEGNEKEEVYYTSFDVIYKMFKDAEIKPFENTGFLNEERAQQHLNYGSYTNPDAEEIKIEGFVSGVATQPMMMLATQNVVVLQFEDDTNFDKYLEAMKGIQFSQICVSPDPEKVKVVRNGNFLCYIAADMGDEDYGDALEKAFLNIDFTEAPNYSEANDAYSRAVQIYFENRDIYEISEITNIMNPAYFINPKETEEILNEETTEEESSDETSGGLGQNGAGQNTADKEETSAEKITDEDIAGMYLVNTAIDYSSKEKTMYDFGAYVIEVTNTEKLELVKSLVEEGLTTEGNYFEQSADATTTVEIEGNFIIITIVK